jgi:glucose/arabinose dehydrogenase
MRNLLKVLIVTAIAAVAMFGADSSIGTWKLNPAKSTSTSTNALKSRTEVYEASADGSVKITRTDQRADGTSLNYSYTFKYDGKEYPVTGALFDSIAQKRVDANTTTIEVKKGSTPYHQTGRIVVSKDGKTRTMTVKGTDAAGKPVSATYVFDKQ